jgi:predicted cupin superfamily sugar epimerase
VDLTADRVRDLLGLEPHWEGGHFVETYRSGLRLDGAALPDGYGGPRAAGTAIYYLFTPGGISRLHRVRSDEVFHHYLGDPVEMLLLFPDGSSRRVALGPDLEAGARPQVVVPAGVWQGSRLAPGGRLALAGATVAPGFDPRDYEGADREALERAYPAEADLILELTP